MQNGDNGARVSGHIGRESGTDLSPRLTGRFTSGQSGHHQAAYSGSRGNDSLRTDTFQVAMSSVDSNKSIQSIPEESEQNAGTGTGLSTPQEMEAQITEFEI